MDKIFSFSKVFWFCEQKFLSLRLQSMIVLRSIKLVFFVSLPLVIYIRVPYRSPNTALDSASSIRFWVCLHKSWQLCHGSTPTSTRESILLEVPFWFPIQLTILLEALRYMTESAIDEHESVSDRVQNFFADFQRKKAFYLFAHNDAARAGK